MPDIKLIISALTLKIGYDDTDSIDIKLNC